MKFRDLFYPICLSCLAFCFSGSFTSALAHSPGIEVVLENLARFETEVRSSQTPVERCRKAIRHSWLTQLIPYLRQRAEKDADADWEEFQETSRKWLNESRIRSHNNMKLVFTRLSNNSSPFGDSQSCDPAIRDLVFPAIQARISSLIAEAPHMDVINRIDHFLFHTLEIQLQIAMRNLLAEKVTRGLKLWELRRQLEDTYFDGKSNYQMDLIVEQSTEEILTTATDIQMIDTLVESGMKRLRDICLGEK